MTLKKEEKLNTIQVNQEEVLMLENNLSFQSEILKRYGQLKDVGAFSEVQYINQQNIVAETRGKLLQTKAERLRQTALLDQQTAQLKSELADLSGRLVEIMVTLRYQSSTASDGVVLDMNPLPVASRQSTDGDEDSANSFSRGESGGLRTRLLRPGAADCPKDPDACKKADISIDSFPASDFGVLEGKVARMAPTQLSQTPRSNVKS